MSFTEFQSLEGQDSRKSDKTNLGALAHSPLWKDLKTPSPDEKTAGFPNLGGIEYQLNKNRGAGA